MGAKSSAVGYVAIKRQAGLDNPVGGADMTSGATASGNPRYFIKALPGIKFSQQVEATRYRTLGGGGRDETLELKEGVTQDPEFEAFAQAVTAGMMLQAATGPSTKAVATQSLGGGQVSNGLVRRPAPHATPMSSTLDVIHDAGATTVTINDAVSLAVGDWMAIGWGPTLEFFQVQATVTTAKTILVKTTGLSNALLYPHVKGEPVMRCLAVARLTADLPDSATNPLVITVDNIVGFAAARKIAFGAIGLAAGTSNGAEFGQSEEINTHATIAPASTSITLAAGAHPLLNVHSTGAWVYDVGAAADPVPTTMIHCFEPLTSLDGENDYFSLARAVSSVIYEQVVDAKNETFSLMGEAKKPLKMKLSFASRYGKHVASALTENYVFQTDQDIPFRFQNGKYLFKIGADIELSSKCYGFDFNPSNIVAKDIFTDSIVRDQVMDLARTSDLAPKFYFQSGAAYNEIMYGSSSPADGALPSPNMATGYVVLDFRISDTERMAIWIPSVTWSGFPVEADPEPKPITVEAKCTPLKSGTKPLFLAAVYNKEVGRY